MNQKTCKKLREIARRMTGNSRFLAVKTRGDGKAKVEDVYETLKKRHAALPRNERHAAIEGALWERTR